jgi:hypothetical protein
MQSPLVKSSIVEYSCLFYKKGQLPLEFYYFPQPFKSTVKWLLFWMLSCNPLANVPGGLKYPRATTPQDIQYPLYNEEEYWQPSCNFNRTNVQYWQRSVKGPPIRYFPEELLKCLGYL